VSEQTGLERLRAKPVIDEIEPRSLELIKSQVAKDCTDGEVGYFLELAAHYDLDPFAKEIWCVKNRGRLLIMVGRDGLRKVAQRQGLRIDGDVVREHDDFGVGRNEHGRIVHHDYGKLADRGQIVGAWCEVTDMDGGSRGFFYAPLSEYKPIPTNEHSPWAKQTSVMILAAAERQALRQSTPLAGILAEGEDESAAAVSTGMGSGEPLGIPLPKAVEAVITRATQMGHAGLADRATIEVAIGGQPEEFVEDWVKSANVMLDTMEPTEAEVVEPIPGQEELNVDA
jgi:hypothetical protein